MYDFEKMRDQMENGVGFIAALDQSGGSTPKALALYGVDPDQYSGEAEMFAEIQNMRARIMTAQSFSADKVIGAILFERTLNETVDGMKVPAFIWEKRGVVPFLKIDKGLEERTNDVQLMKPIPGLAERLAEARPLGIFGTKERSVIHEANTDGIAAIVENQFDVADTVIEAGMVPIVEPEINIHAETKPEAEQMLADALLARVNKLGAGQNVMLKLTIPEAAGQYDALAAHPNVLRVVALSGGYSTVEACERLCKQPSMIASFSRALAEGLQKPMSDIDFEAKIGSNIEQIYQASR